MVSPDEGSKGEESSESELDEEAVSLIAVKTVTKAVLKEVKAKRKVERTVHLPPSINPLGVHWSSPDCDGKLQTIMNYPSAIVIPNKL